MSEGKYDPGRGRLSIAAGTLATGMAFIDATALVLAMPAIQNEFGASMTELLWVHSIYAIPLTALLLL